MIICPNCSEKITRLNEKCPKCGVIPKNTRSPLLIGLVMAIGLIALVVISLVV